MSVVKLDMTMVFISTSGKSQKSLISQNENVSVVALNAQSIPRAEALALRLGIKVSCDPNAVSGLVLEVSQDRLGLRDTAQPRARALTIEAAKRRYPAAGKDLLSRALGRQCESVIDATAGFGADTFDFVRRGKTVFAIERVEVAAIMLEEAASAFRPGLEGGTLEVVCGDAIERIGALATVDVIFLDPMFPDRSRHTAQPRKAQQLLRRLAGEDPDAGTLLQVARIQARRRVIVKRPRHAPPLGGTPDIVHNGKAVRYDVYLPDGGAS